MKEIRLARKVITTLTKDRILYPGRLITDTFSLIARCGVLLILYWYVFQLSDGVVHGTPYSVVAWSMFFYFAFSAFRLRDIARVIMRDVQSGNVELLFSKPISYLRYRIWWQVGSGLYSFLVSLVLGSIVLTPIVGLPQTMTVGIFVPTTAVIFIGSAVLSLLVYSIVGLIAFWIEEVEPIFWIVDKAGMILGGSYLPVALFPDFMYKLAIYSPFGASQFVSHTVNESWQQNWYFLIGLQLFWIAAFILIAFVMVGRARKRVFVNGG